MAVSLDLFGTLVAVDRPAEPAAAVATALRERGVRVPDDWPRLYREPHTDRAPGEEYPLPAHVAEALAAADTDAPQSAVTAAVRAAFAPETVTTREGGAELVAAARERGPVCVLSNCSVPGLVADVLARSDLDPSTLSAVVTSVDCGWRKPHPRAFGAAADALGVDAAALVHVGDDPETDGGISDVGGEFLPVADRSLAEARAELEGRT